MLEGCLLHRKKKLFIFAAIMFAKNYNQPLYFISAPMVLSGQLLRLAR
jgi:hypothetical protein